jgi:hypothetical protein
MKHVSVIRLLPALRSFLASRNSGLRLNRPEELIRAFNWYCEVIKKLN